MSKQRRGPSSRAASSHQPDRNGTFAMWLAVLALVVFLPDAFTRWFLPKELLLLVALVFASRASARGRMPRSLWLLIGVGAVVLGIAALASDNPVGALMGRWPRYEGLVALPVYAAAVWVGARLLGPQAPLARIGSFTRAIVVASLLIGIVSILEGLGLRPIPGDADRPGSLLGNATDQGLIGAAMALILLPVIASSLAAARSRLLLPGRVRGAERMDVLAGPAMLLFAVLASVLTVVISASRAGLLALAVGLGVLLVVQVARRARLHGARAGWVAAGQGAAVAGIIAGITFAVPAMRDRLLGVTELSMNTITDRLAMWRTTAEMVAERPLLGVGPSGFLDAVAVRHDADWYRSVGPGTVLDSPHNWVLQAASAGGVPLLLAAVVLAVTVLVLAARRLGELWPGRTTGGIPSAHPDARFDLVLGCLAAIVGLGLGLLTHFTTAPTAILMGLLIGVATAVAPRPERASWVRVRTGVFILWLAIFAVITAAELPLAAGVHSKTAVEADSQFEVAQGLRPWDGDIASIAAQAFTAKADAGDATAIPLAVGWAERAVMAQPKNLAGQYALGVALRSAGEVRASGDIFLALHDAHPANPRVLMQLGLTRIVGGDLAAGTAMVSEANRLTPDDESIALALKWARSLG